LKKTVPETSRSDKGGETERPGSGTRKEKMPVRKQIDRSRSGGEEGGGQKWEKT